MEKRVLFAFLLSLIVITVYQAFFAPKVPVDPPETKEVSRDSGDPQSPTPQDTGVAPSSTNVPPASQSGNRRDGDAAPVNDDEISVRNEALHFRFDRRGAALVSGRLLEHREHVDSPEGLDGSFEFLKTYEGGPRALTLGSVDEDNAWMDQALWDVQSLSDDGREVRFVLPVIEEIGADKSQVRYRVIKTIRLHEGRSQRADVEVAVEFVSGEATLTKTFDLSSSGGVFPAKIVGAQILRAHSVVAIGSEKEQGLERVGFDDIVDEKKKNARYGPSAAVADMGLYFGVYLRHVEGGQAARSVVRAFDPAPGEALEGETAERLGARRTMASLGVNLELGPNKVKDVVTFDYYVGAKDHREIKRAYDEGDTRELYLALADSELTAQGFCCGLGPLEGVITLISKAVISALSFFNGIFGSMGIAIIVLTLCVRTLLFPITRRSQVAMQTHAAKMAKVKPKLDKLKEKYGDDRQLFAQKQMEMMKEEKVQLVPVGGCLPMFLQIPIFFGLFSAIRFDFDLRHSPFLWAPDLSVPDRLISLAEPFKLECCIPAPPISIDGLNIFPLLMITAMFFHQLGMPKSPDPQMAQQQKIMMFMPIFFGVLMYGYAAGLSLYWLSSSLFGIFEQRVIKKLFPIDKDQGKSDGDAKSVTVEK